MKRIYKLGLIGLSAVVLSACGGDNNDGISEVLYEDLVNTGLSGYKINVDIAEGGGEHTGITYYFCTSLLGPNDEDYAAVTGELTGEEPDFDHGYLIHENEYLDFETQLWENGYSIISETEMLQEGQTYTLDIWGAENGTVLINSIKTLDCSTLPEPIEPI